MKKLLVIALVMALVLVGGVMAVQTGQTTATLTVNEVIDITIGGAIPIDFGSLNPGTANNSATGGAVTITIESTTNIDTDTYLKGVSWTTPAALDISNVIYDDDATLGEITPQGNPVAIMSTAYGVANTGYFENEVCPCGGGTTVKSVYFWLTVPSGQQAGSYIATNIDIKTVKDGATP